MKAKKMTQAAKPTSPATREDDPILAREKKLAALKAAGINPYPHVFARSAKAHELHEKYAGLKDGEETKDVVRVAGRIMAIRNSGMFLDVTDPSGKVQVFCHKDSMSEAEMTKLEFFDIGDIVGAIGTMRRTPRGELSVRATEIHMLVKTMLPLPEKYHGLTDVETRYRQRYLDLIMNEDSKRTLRLRAQIVAKIREYLTGMGGLEVETPMLHPILGGASAKPFTTHHNALDNTFYLRIAPELYLKRLMVGGLADHVFEINRNFRNEGVSTRHNPEFTMIESYHAYMDYKDVMNLIEDMVRHIVLSIHGTLEVPFGDKTIDFSGPWKRASMTDLVKEQTGFDFMTITDAETARAKAKELGVHVDKTASWGQCVEAVFGEKVEHTLIQPTHVMDFPFEISPLSKNHRDNPRLVERFETYVNTWEICNAFTELNDPKVQYERFMDQVAQREAGDDEAQMLDQDFVTALQYGLPPCAGWGMGIDRLVMVLTNSPSIRDVINFPTLKPVDAHKPVTKTAASASSAQNDNDRYLNVDEEQYRFVVVVNEKEENIGRVMNAIGHTMAGLAAGANGAQDFCLIDYADADGNVHPNISHYPVIVLKAKNSNQIAKVREGAQEKGIPFTDFTTDMTIGTSKEQVESLRSKKADAIEYLGISLFGKTSDIKELTGKLSLYK